MASLLFAAVASADFWRVLPFCWVHLAVGLYGAQESYIDVCTSPSDRAATVGPVPAGLFEIVSRICWSQMRTTSSLDGSGPYALRSHVETVGLGLGLGLGFGLEAA